MDLIGDILDHSSAGYKWILVAPDYFTKWVEEIPTRKATHQVVMVCRFGVPVKIIADNAMRFRAKPFVAMCKEYGINLTYASNYNP